MKSIPLLAYHLKKNLILKSRCFKLSARMVQIETRTMLYHLRLFCRIKKYCINEFHISMLMLPTLRLTQTFLEIENRAVFPFAASPLLSAQVNHWK